MCVYQQKDTEFMFFLCTSTDIRRDKYPNGSCQHKTMWKMEEGKPFFVGLAEYLVGSLMNIVIYFKT